MDVRKKPFRSRSSPCGCHTERCSLKNSRRDIGGSLDFEFRFIGFGHLAIFRSFSALLFDSRTVDRKVRWGSFRRELYRLSVGRWTGLAVVVVEELVRPVAIRRNREASHLIQRSHRISISCADRGAHSPWLRIYFGSAFLPSNAATSFSRTTKRSGMRPVLSGGTLSR
jgi:hypothetical protein